MIHIRLLSRVLGQQNFDSEQNIEKKKASTDKIRAVETNKQTNKQTKNGGQFRVREH